MPIVETLKKRPEFLRVRGGRRYSCDAFLIEGRGRQRLQISSCEGSTADEADKGGGQKGGLDALRVAAGPAALGAVSTGSAGAGLGGGGARFGFTITKKIGNAVTRNRIRRRLKAAVAEAMTAAPFDFDAIDYVVVARRPAAIKPFDELVFEVMRAAKHIKRTGRRRDGQAK